MIGLPKFIKESYNKYIEPHCSGPVWSKVFSGLILFMSGLVFIAIYAGIGRTYRNIPVSKFRDYIHQDQQLEQDHFEGSCPLQKLP